MKAKEIKVIMSLCKQMFDYTPKTVAEFAAFINYLETRADGE